jgi:hypothetical protein
MSIIAADVRLEAADDCMLDSWHEVDDGFWAGSSDGRFLGTVERHSAHRYFARDSARAYVGEFRSLDRAKGAIVARAA